MERNILLKCNALVFLIAGMLAITPALADKPSWAGGDKGDRGDRGEQNDRHDGRSKHGGGKHASSDREGRDSGGYEHFSDRHRTVIHEYYAEEFRTGHCPPGLAKKRNGCMPPGQARKWKVGQPLPRDVIYYDLPPPVIARIGPPPAGHRYVRVAGDILLMAIGTGMIVDAIDDLSR
ncbi:MAG: RcnB family protein [Gallionellaceae bacterium]|nr:RcnB family protein [Gallionellaceae bacterium]